MQHDPYNPIRSPKPPSGHLPTAAATALQEAAQTRNEKKISTAIDWVKNNYPDYFRPNGAPDSWVPPSRIRQLALYQRNPFMSKS